MRFLPQSLSGESFQRVDDRCSSRKGGNGRRAVVLGSGGSFRG